MVEEDSGLDTEEVVLVEEDSSRDISPMGRETRDSPVGQAETEWAEGTEDRDRELTQPQCSSRQPRHPFQPQQHSQL